MNEKIKQKLQILPLEPGCYLMKDKSGNIIYVGKAKKLKNRVSQYFNRENTGKTALLVSNIDDFDYIVTKTEKECLLLEFNLIKKHMPKYNIMLKDGTHYPYIMITKEEHPRLKIVRKVVKGKGTYFGPYSNSGAARNVVNMLNRVYPLRKCDHLPHKACFYYQTGQCLGPCINDVKVAESSIVSSIIDFLNGDTKEVISTLNKKMYEASEKMQYEEAQEYKNMIDSIKHITENQNIEFKSIFNCDVVGFHERDGYLSVAILFYRNGLLVGKHTDVFPYYDSIEDSLYSYIQMFYDSQLLPKNLMVPNVLDINEIKEIVDCNVIIPSKGKYKEILEMVANNAIKAMEEKVLGSAKYQDNLELMKSLEELLGVENIKRIEMLDNSHTGGDELVSGIVCFINGVPSKKDYRKYRLSNPNSRDDFASTYETVYKRLYKYIEGEAPLMDLLIVDGGYAQLHKAKEVASEMNVNVNIIGLVKNDKHQTRAIIDLDENEITLDKNDSLFLFLMKLQEEVHRFAITYHHSKRAKSFATSILDEVKGLGKVRKEKLLETYKTIDNIKKCSVEELAQFIPTDVAVELLKKLNA